MNQLTAKRGPGRPAEPVTREQLLKAARVAFAARGYSGASVAFVASQVGLTKASLFHHFPTKEALYLAMMNQIFTELTSMIERARLDTGSFAARLHRLGEGIADYLGDNPAVASLLLQSQVLPTPLIDRGGRTTALALLATAVEFLEAGVQAGEFRCQDSAHVLNSLIGAHLYHFATPQVSGALMGADVFTAAQVARRKQEVVRHIASICERSD